MTTEHPRIALDPQVLAGKPVIRGTRIAVEFVIGLMADGWTEAEILANYPGIEHEDVIEQAREDAFALVDGDPDLADHPLLAAAVQARVDAEQAAYLERG